MRSTKCYDQGARDYERDKCEVAFFKNRSSINIKTRHHRTMVVVSMVPFACATIGCPVLAATVHWELLTRAVLDAASEAAGCDIVARFVSHRQASSA